ncbi:SDR family NAD(P)-dependent oxidoreductase [Burkholderia vietnamiensis]|uniref:SDR family NAD(P)-dependent oxidoreductase n=1 Tax=Burkholderia vietnamiensis TaxID=60552 RepID=UPI0009BFD811|nr:SDR family NAD(P)-dependent oxidoreductase [Burkholderia vietnamiensis]TPQ30811.1 KR domain-containing protein [Burkholderia ubonensis]MBR8356920.1 SDR family NAD(P)-dependent oxidoreductase [Burkholderia vietnamiensis]MDN7924685.1 SDR family NAD(P)-dependent oxidoreductase [Burkholderia vietnamiensis]HDR9057745.1 SDR family NAD(P)-dependent oxidoreductase [Burkholderia vietnamiensis]HDR9156053.1 SDR family NAD(P)-dependent oxidoreductase [Burkholderia vietnamiensis]
MKTETSRGVAVVTGASSGFGWAICHRLARDGYQIVAAARRIERLHQLKEALGDAVLPIELDVRDPGAVIQAQTTVLNAVGHVDVLVNNAGLALGLERAQEAKLEDWQAMIDTNVTGLTRVTHAFLPSMVERGRGHVINLGSVAGTYPYPGGNVYGATKAFVAQFSLNLRADLAGTGVRVTDLQPGLCGGTEFSFVRFRGDEKRATSLYDGVDPLMPEDIAETVSWVASLPPHFNVNAMEIMPTAQSFAALNVSRRS